MSQVDERLTGKGSERAGYQSWDTII